MFWQLKQLLDHETNPSRRPIVAGPPDPPDLQVAVQVQELPHRHGVMLSAASGLGLAMGWLGLAMAALVDHPLFYQPSGLSSSQVVSSTLLSWKMWRQLQPLQPQGQSLQPLSTHRR